MDSRVTVRERLRWGIVVVVEEAEVGSFDEFGGQETGNSVEAASGLVEVVDCSFVEEEGADRKAGCSYWEEAVVVVVKMAVGTVAGIADMREDCLTGKAS